MGEIINVPLFQSAHVGFGDGRLIRPHRYNRILRGFDPTHPGELRFGPYLTQYSYTSGTGFPLDEAPVFAWEWRETDDVTPAIYFIATASGVSGIYQLTGVLSTDATRVAAFTSGSIATDAAMHDDGGGVPFVYVAFEDVAVVSRVNLSLSETALAATINRDKLYSAAGHLYGSVKPSGTGTHYSQVAFVLPNVDPDTAANWSTPLTVGWPNTDINTISSIRGLPVVLKPEGIFVYNRSRELWENRMPSWESMPHPDNGRGALPLGQSLIIPMGRGGAVIFDGYSVKDFSPHTGASPNIDTTSQGITSMAATPLGIMALTTQARAARGGRGSRRAHGNADFLGTNYNMKLTRRGGADDDGSDIEGTRFIKTQDDQGTFTDYTTQVNDGRMSTVAVLDSQDTAANGDYFYIGHPRPWQAVQFILNKPNGSSSDLAAQLWNGSSWVNTSITDLTESSSATLGQSQLVAFVNNPVSDTDTWTAALLATITGNAVSNDQVCYWARFAVSAALDAEVEISAISLLPYRPTIDDVNFSEDSRDRSGIFAHILLATLTEEGPLWHDLGATLTIDDMSCLLTAELPGTYGNSTNRVMAVGRFQTVVIETGLTDNWPFIAPRGLIEFPFIDPAQGQPVRLLKLRIRGRNFDGVAQTFFYWRYGATERWSSVKLGNQLPAAVDIPNDASGGSEFQYAYGFTMTLDTVAATPTVTGIEALFEIMPEEIIASRPIAEIPRG